MGILISCTTLGIIATFTVAIMVRDDRYAPKPYVPTLHKKVPEVTINKVTFTQKGYIQVTWKTISFWHKHWINTTVSSLKCTKFLSLLLVVNLECNFLKYFTWDCHNFYTHNFVCSSNICSGSNTNWQLTPSMFFSSCNTSWTCQIFTNLHTVSGLEVLIWLTHIRCYLIRVSISLL